MPARGWRSAAHSSRIAWRNSEGQEGSRSRSSARPRERRARAPASTSRTAPRWRPSRRSGRPGRGRIRCARRAGTAGPWGPPWTELLPRVTAVCGLSFSATKRRRRRAARNEHARLAGETGLTHPGRSPGSSPSWPRAVRPARDPVASDAAHPDHRPGERRQGGRRARPPPRRASARPAARRADGGRRRALPARAGRLRDRVRRRGAHVRAARARDRRVAPGSSARPLGRVARDRVVRAAIADVPLRVLRALGGDAGLRRRRRRAVRRAPALARHAGAVHVRAADVGGGRRPRRVRRRARRALLGLSPAAGSGSAGPTARATRGRRSTRCAPSPARGAAGRCSSTASTT